MRKIMMLFLIIPIITILSSCDKAPAPAMQSDYTPVDFDSLKNDIDHASGAKAKVSGLGLLSKDVFMISKESGDLASIYVDINSLSTEERKSILAKCSNSGSRCRIVVYGTVGKANYQNAINANKNGLIADKIEL
jgi:hypothetical protein